MQNVEQKKWSGLLMAAMEILTAALFVLAREPRQAEAAVPASNPGWQCEISEFDKSEEVEPAATFPVEFSPIPVLPVRDVHEVGFVEMNGVRCIIMKGATGDIGIHAVSNGEHIGSGTGIEGMSILPGIRGVRDQLIFAKIFGFGADAKSKIAEVLGSLGPNGGFLYGGIIEGLDDAFDPFAEWLLNGQTPVLTIFFSTQTPEGLPSGSYVAFKNPQTENSLSDQDASPGFEVFELTRLPKVGEKQRIIIDMPTVEGMQRKLVLSIKYDPTTDTYSVQTNVLSISNIDGNWSVDVGAPNVFAADNLTSAQFVSEQIVDAHGTNLALVMASDGSFNMVESSSPDEQGQVESHLRPVRDARAGWVAEGMFTIAGGRIIGVFRDEIGTRHFFLVQKEDGETYSLKPVELVGGDPDQQYILDTNTYATFTKVDGELGEVVYAGNIVSNTFEPDDPSEDDTDLYQSTTASRIKFRMNSLVPQLILSTPISPTVSLR